MIHSMTAFARKEQAADDGSLTWEIRSVNHRFLETHLRLPEELRGLDPLVRRKLAKKLGRGKLDCSLRYEPASHCETALRLNEHLIHRLIDAASRIEGLIHEAVPLRTMDILAWPGVLEADQGDLSTLEQRAQQLLDAALEELIHSRADEGARLAKLISDRCQLLEQLVDSARQKMPQVLDHIRSRLRERLEEISADLDHSRIEQELALMAQRLDVDEEMDRLANHIEEIQNTLKRQEPVGRRLDFLMQELNREANTLGAKSNDLELTRISVEMKVLIEQMREQIQNIE